MQQQPVYLPGKVELASRILFQNRVVRYGWSDDLIRSVMLDDMPTIDAASALIDMYGERRAQEVIREFLS